MSFKIDQTVSRQDVYRCFLLDVSFFEPPSPTIDRILDPQAMNPVGTACCERLARVREGRDPSRKSQRKHSSAAILSNLKIACQLFETSRGI